LQADGEQLARARPGWPTRRLCESAHGPFAVEYAGGFIFRNFRGRRVPAVSVALFPRTPAALQPYSPTTALIGLNGGLQQAWRSIATGFPGLQALGVLLGAECQTCPPLARTSYEGSLGRKPDHIMGPCYRCCCTSPTTNDLDLVPQDQIGLTLPSPAASAKAISPGRG
jgi:hypothetical protein